MLSLSPEILVAQLAAAPPELIWLLLLVVCFGGVVLMARFFGAAGLYAYIVVAVIGANVQVLKPVQFSVFADPVALGTVLFASTYLCTDILAERCGSATARRGVLLGFAAYLLWSLLMVMTLSFRPMTAEQAGDGLAWALPVNDALRTLFLPVPALFAAGMTAYLVSQLHDVWLFGLIRRLTGERALWLRNIVSTWVSALIDNIVFSVLAWVVFAAHPLGWHPLIYTYILGTYGLRIVVAVLDTPFVYLARRAMRTDDA